MGEADYIIYLTSSYDDWYRHYHLTRKSQVLEFRIQYEAFIGGEWHEIVRHDTAHGRPHRDMTHPDGTQTKEEFYGYTPDEVLTYGERDIKRNWQRYRIQYEREMER